MRDVLIIGAGPAGLTAATYLGRFRRPTEIIDAGSSRARWIPESHNIPAFAHGIGGPKLLDQLREQAAHFGTTITPGTVHSISSIQGGYVVRFMDQTVQCRFVLVSTGILDKLPPIPGADEALSKGVLKICPICDAYEAIDKNIAVIGDGEHAMREAEFLRAYSARITVLHLNGPCAPEMKLALNSQGVRVLQTDIADLEIGPHSIKKRPNQYGPAALFDLAYSALGCTPQNKLAVRLGAKLDDSGALMVSAHQETSVPGIYAAGDVVRGLNQVVVAAAEAAIAATHIHNRLRSAGV